MRSLREFWSTDVRHGSWITFWRRLLGPANTIWIPAPPLFVMPSSLVCLVGLYLGLGEVWLILWFPDLMIWHFYQILLVCQGQLCFQSAIEDPKEVLCTSILNPAPSSAATELYYDTGRLWQEGLMTGRIFPIINIFQWRRSSCYDIFSTNSGQVNPLKWGWIQSMNAISLPIPFSSCTF